MESSYGFLFVVIGLIVLFVLINGYFKKPFSYPRIVVNVDIFKKRQPVYDDYIDEWINGLPNHKQSVNDEFTKALNKWDLDCEAYIKRSFLWQKHRIDLYRAIRHQVVQRDYQMFEFVFSRSQTRYSQKNYQKTAYVVQNVDNTLIFTLSQLLDIADELDEINYETTRTKWCAKNQRKLMTKDLRIKIKQRDNYTCQICGKYMPDEVGLHIDHIIPIKKGGKSVESNLQVLCDKCNLSKSSK